MVGRISNFGMAGTALLVVCAMSLLAGGAAMACSSQIVASPPADLSYNPFDAAGQSREYRVTVKNTAAEACTLFLSFVRLAGGGGPASGPEFEIRGKDGSLLIASAPSPAAVGQLVSRPLAAGETYEFTYLVTIPAGQMLPPGSYGQPVELQLQAVSGSEALAAAPYQTGLLTIVCNVAEHLGVNIAGGGTGTTIDFGVLVQGQMRRVLIQTRSNRKFSLKVTSANGGALAMAEPYTQWRIPYRMELDGRESTPPAMIGPYVATVLSGNSVEASFTIGDVSGKRAGLYTDCVTIEIIPVI